MLGVFHRRFINAAHVWRIRWVGMPYDGSIAYGSTVGSLFPLFLNDGVEFICCLFEIGSIVASKAFYMATSIGETGKGG